MELKDGFEIVIAESSRIESETAIALSMNLKNQRRENKSLGNNTCIKTKELRRTKAIITKAGLRICKWLKRNANFYSLTISSS